MRGKRPDDERFMNLHYGITPACAERLLVHPELMSDAGITPVCGKDAVLANVACPCYDHLRVRERRFTA